jgi:hypothetical protein
VTRHELPVRLARIEVDPNDGAAGIRDGCFDGTCVRDGGIRGSAMNDCTMIVMPVMVPTVVVVTFVTIV